MQLHRLQRYSSGRRCARPWRRRSRQTSTRCRARAPSPSSRSACSSCTSATARLRRRSPWWKKRSRSTMGGTGEC
eukprot:1029108-Rhodomonas_salina.1